MQRPVANDYQLIESIDIFSSIKIYFSQTNDKIWSLDYFLCILINVPFSIEPISILNIAMRQYN